MYLIAFMADGGRTDADADRGGNFACLQGISKRWAPAPGCVKLDEKVAICLPTAGRRTQLFHHIFTQAGKGSF